MFGGLPYDRYVFILHLSSQGHGGLEHKYACSLNYPTLGFARISMSALCSWWHEFSLVECEADLKPWRCLITTRKTTRRRCGSVRVQRAMTIIPLRAGIYDAKSFLNNLGKEITVPDNAGAAGATAE